MDCTSHPDCNSVVAGDVDDEGSLRHLAAVAELVPITRLKMPGAMRRSRWQSPCRSLRVLGLAALVALLLEVLKVGDEVATLNW